MFLKFPFDAYYNGELVYKKGEVYDVPEEGNQAARWIKRGAVVVDAPKKEENVDKASKKRGASGHKRLSE